jgi:hypothetical protein
VAEISGTIDAGEAAAAERAYGRRIWGLGRFLPQVVRLLIFLGVIPAALVAPAIIEDKTVRPIFGLVAAIAYFGVAIFTYQRWVRWSAWRASRRFGVATSHRMTIRQTDHSLVADGETWRIEVQWRSIVEILRAGPVWVFAGQSTTIYVPRRFFADLAAERAFLAAALGRLSDEAVQRSVTARRVAEGGV